MKKSLGAKTLIFPTPVWVIGTYDKEGKPNAMTAAWGGVCSSKPPCVAVSLRSATYSHGNIVYRKAFTVNVPSAKHIKEADYFGIASGRNTDKIKTAGLTAIKSEKVDAPYIEQFPLILECKLVNTVEVGIHTHFIGEIIDVIADEIVMDKNGMPDISLIKPMIYAPEVRSYYGIGEYLGQAHNIGRNI